MRMPSVILVAISMWARFALADPTAESLNQDGIKAAKAKDWDVARQRFEESYALSPRPSTLYNLANALERTDRLLAARASYTKYLADTRPGQNDGFRSRATTALASLDSAIPTLHVHISGFDHDAVVVVDAQDVTAVLDTPIAVDPGDHAVEIERGHDVLARRTVTVHRGAREDLELTAPPHIDTPAVGVAQDVKPATPPPAIAITTTIPPPVPTSPSRHSIWTSPWFLSAATIVVLGAAGAGFYHFVYESGDPTHGTLGRGVYTVP
jgi:hypothetical protein